MSLANIDPQYLVDLQRSAVEYATLAGKMALQQFQRGIVDVEYKGHGRRDPVTVTDRQIENRLRALIAERFPEHGFLGEESSAAVENRRFLWVIDPVDGTANFASGLPLFAVSIGVLFEGSPVTAAVYVMHPGHAEGVVVHARLGGGCFRGDRRLNVFDERDLHPSRPAALPAAFWRRFTLGPGLRWQPIEVRTLGSIAYEITLVAGGALQFAAYRAPRIWDVAAGVLLVSEARGSVFEWQRQQRAWRPFRRFEPPPSNRSRQEPSLHHWAAPLILGGPTIATIVAQSLRPRAGLQLRLWPLIWRLFGS